MSLSAGSRLAECCHKIYELAMLNFGRYGVIFVLFNKHTGTALEVETDSCRVARKPSAHHRTSKRRGRLTLDVSMCQ